MTGISPTIGIPLASFREGDSPSYDNATWFNHLAFPNTVSGSKKDGSQSKAVSLDHRLPRTPLRERAAALRNGRISPAKARRIARRDKAQLGRIYLKMAVASDDHS